MTFSAITKRIVALSCTLALASCSFLGSHTQSIQITVNDPDAVICVNGEPVGKGSVLADVPIQNSTVISAEHGSKYTNIVLSRTLSPVGAIDMVAGYVLLIPFIGLASPGAYKFNQDIIELYLD